MLEDYLRADLGDTLTKEQEVYMRELGNPYKDVFLLNSGHGYVDEETINQKYELTFGGLYDYMS